MRASVPVLDQIAVTRYLVATVASYWSAWCVCVALGRGTSPVATCLVVPRAAAVQIDRSISYGGGGGHCVSRGYGLSLCAVEILSIRHILLLS